MATAPAQTIEDSIADEVYDVMTELCDLRQDMLRISTDVSRMADRVSVELEWTRSLMNRIDRAHEQALTEPAARVRARSRRKARRNERRRWASGTLVVKETADGAGGGDAVEAIDDVSLPETQQQPINVDNVSFFDAVAAIDADEFPQSSAETQQQP